MIFAVITIVALAVGAVSLAVMDKALGPDNHNFPCATPLMHWILRLYALALFNRAALLTASLWSGSTPKVGVDVVFATVAMASVHGVLLYLLLRAQLPSGVWGRLQRRAVMERRR